MLTRFFNKSEPFGFIALILLLIVFVSVSVFGTNVSVSSEILFYYASIIAFQIVLLIIANVAISKNNLTPNNYYALFVFVLLFGFFPDTITQSKITFAHLFILLASLRLYGLQNKKDSTLKLFDIGFFLGIAYLLYPLSILFFIIAFISYFLFIKNIEKELFIPILGFITPVFLSFVYFFVFGETKDFITLIGFNIGFDEIHYNRSNWFGIVFLVGIVFYASYSNIKHLHKGGVNMQQNIKLIFAHLIFTVFISILYLSNLKESIQFIFFPIAVLIGNSIVNIEKNWVKEMLLISLFLGSLISLFIT